MKQFQSRLPDGKIPGLLLKHYMQHLLLGLDYIHTECGIIHTGEEEQNSLPVYTDPFPQDIKQDNILMTFEDPEVIEDFAQSQAKNPMPRKILNNRSISMTSAP